MKTMHEIASEGQEIIFEFDVFIKTARVINRTEGDITVWFEGEEGDTAIVDSGVARDLKPGGDTKAVCILPGATSDKEIEVEVTEW